MKRSYWRCRGSAPVYRIWRRHIVNPQEPLHFETLTL